VVVIRTPLRVSFAGGGSDRPEYVEERGPGATVSATVSRYVYVTAHRRAVEPGVRVAYTHTEEVATALDVEHSIVREAMRMTGVTSAVEVHSIGQLPSAGSGLGASSALAVGCLHALRRLRGESPLAPELACEACDLELGRLSQRIGRQDQWACALGGVREYRFLRDGQVESHSLHLDQYAREMLECHLFLVWTGLRRGMAAQDALAEQTDFDTIGILAEMVPSACEFLRQGDMVGLGGLLHESWGMKRALSSRVTTPEVDATYARARDAGALGGKLCGAGGGGCLLLLVHPAHQSAVREAVRPCIHVPAGLDFKGSVRVYEHAGCRL